MITGCPWEPGGTSGLCFCPWSCSPTAGEGLPAGCAARWGHWGSGLSVQGSDQWGWAGAHTGPRGPSQLQVPRPACFPGLLRFRGPLWVVPVCSLLFACQSPPLPPPHPRTPLFSPPSCSVQFSPVSGFVLQTRRFLFSHLGNWCYLLKVTLELQPAGVRRSGIELKGVEIGWKQEEDLSGMISLLQVASSL